MGGEFLFKDGMKSIDINGRPADKETVDNWNENKTGTIGGSVVKIKTPLKKASTPRQAGFGLRTRDSLSFFKAYPVKPSPPSSPNEFDTSVVSVNILDKG